MGSVNLSADAGRLTRLHRLGVFELPPSLQLQARRPRTSGLLTELAETFDPERELLRVILRTAQEGRIEYRHLGASYERRGKKLRSTVQQLFK